MTDADYDYIQDEIERPEKIEFERNVSVNSDEDNNNNAIFNVIVNYIIIKYQYVDIIWIFICFSVFSILLDSVIFIPFKYDLVPNCI